MTALFRRTVLDGLLFLVLFSGTAAYAAESESSSPTLYVIGDSTAAAYAPQHYPLFGWAQVLQYYFDATKLRVEDKAISGRSSKNFYDTGSWTPIREALQPGDYVFIQFGHTDQKKKDPARYTEPWTTYTEYLTRYVEETRAAEAIPVLLTSINRNSWESPSKLRDTLGEYPDAVRKLAKAQRVPLIDMHKRTARLYEKLGQERTKRLFIYLPAGLYPAYPDGRPDNTHLQESGAYVICDLAVDAIRKLKLPLRDHLKTGHRSWGFKRRLQQKSVY